MIKVGDLFITKQGYTVEVIKYFNENSIRVRFLDNFKFELYCTARSLRQGSIRNPYHPIVLNRGYHGKYNTGTHESYPYWFNMLRRCYDLKFQERQPKYKGCSVSEDWWDFSNFIDWWKNNYYTVSTGERMELDKDIKFKGNKVYCKESCLFVPSSINRLLTNSKSARGDYPLGVTRVGSRFVARCAVYGELKILGYFDNPIDAFNCYKEFKEHYIKQVAIKYKSEIPDSLYISLLQYEVMIDD